MKIIIDIDTIIPKKVEIGEYKLIDNYINTLKNYCFYEEDYNKFMLFLDRKLTDNKADKLCLHGITVTYMPDIKVSGNMRIDDIIRNVNTIVSMRQSADITIYRDSIWQLNLSISASGEIEIYCVYEYSDGRNGGGHVSVIEERTGAVRVVCLGTKLPNSIERKSLSVSRKLKKLGYHVIS